MIEALINLLLNPDGSPAALWRRPRCAVSFVL
jgi:hypothetical protein